MGMGRCGAVWEARGNSLFPYDLDVCVFVNLQKSDQYFSFIGFKRKGNIKGGIFLPPQPPPGLPHTGEESTANFYPPIGPPFEGGEYC